MPAFTKSNTSDAESSSSQNVSSLFKINYLPILITTLQEWESKISGIYKKMHLQLHLCHIQYSSIIQTTQSILQHTKPCKITRQQSSLKNVRNITNALMWKDYTFLIPCRFVPAKMQSTYCGKRRKHKTLWRDVINARHLACILWWCR